MQNRKNKTRSSRALTLVETVIAMAIMAIIFAALLPQLKMIQNSWDTKVGTFETLQNGRVLIDHIQSNLSRAVRITAVSGPSEINGYIEFERNDANNVRYDIGVNNYVEFGPVGNLYDLAGPVSQLQFNCYDGNDFTTPITDVNSIRFINVQTTLTNPAKLDQDMTLSTNVYIRTNPFSDIAGNIIKPYEPWFEYDINKGLEPALCQIDQNHYLCAFRGPADDGWAIVLTVDTGTWSVSKEVPFKFDVDDGKVPTLAKIDQTHYLCAYQGVDDDGWVCILKVNTGNWTITVEDIFEFDPYAGLTPALVQIDQTHYLCAYTGYAYHGWAVVLTVNTVNWTITKETPFQFDIYQGLAPALSKIDSTHYLCAYTGFGEDGWATVLTVNTGNWTISKKTPFEFDSFQGQEPALTKIDDTHYLCAYSRTGADYDGWATVLTVNTGTWAITKQTPFEFDNTCATPALATVDDTHYLCAYTGPSSDGWSAVLTVDDGNWTISKETPLEFDTIQGNSPALAKIDDNHYLCVYVGFGDNGYAGVLQVCEEILP